MGSFRYAFHRGGGDIRQENSWRTLFEGYEDKIMDIGAALGEGIGDVVLDKFGWFYKV